MMIDQNLATLEEELNALFPKRLKAVSVFELKPDFHNYTEDEDLVQAGRENRYILFTSDDKSIKKRKYPPCTHAGIIKMPGMPSKEEVIARLRKLLLSGPQYLKQIRGHFTYLRNEGATIHKEHNQQVEVTFK
jgi:hypothetical protein